MLKPRKGSGRRIQRLWVTSKPCSWGNSIFDTPRSTHLDKEGSGASEDRDGIIGGVYSAVQGVLDTREGKYS